MKTMTLRYESYEENEVDSFKENGFTVSLIDGSDEAVISSLGDDDCSKLVDKRPFERFWERLKTVNLQKVVFENSMDEGYDGYSISLEVSTGMHSLTLKLWNANVELYKKHGMNESLRFYDLLRDIMDVAFINGFRIFG